MPTRFGGLGISIFNESAVQHYRASKNITSPLVAIMLTQGDFLPDTNEINVKKKESKQQQEIVTKMTSDNIENELNDKTLRSIKEAKQKGHQVG